MDNGGVFRCSRLIICFCFFCFAGAAGRSAALQAPAGAAAAAAAAAVNTIAGDKKSRNHPGFGHIVKKAFLRHDLPLRGACRLSLLFLCGAQAKRGRQKAFCSGFAGGFIIGDFSARNFQRRLQLRVLLFQHGFLLEKNLIPLLQRALSFKRQR